MNTQIAGIHEIAQDMRSWMTLVLGRSLGCGFVEFLVPLAKPEQKLWEFVDFPPRFFFRSNSRKGEGLGVESPSKTVVLAVTFPT